MRRRLGASLTLVAVCVGVNAMPAAAHNYQVEDTSGPKSFHGCTITAKVLDHVHLPYVYGYLASAQVTCSAEHDIVSKVLLKANSASVRQRRKTYNDSKGGTILTSPGYFFSSSNQDSNNCHLQAVAVVKVDGASTTVTTGAPINLCDNYQ